MCALVTGVQTCALPISVSVDGVEQDSDHRGDPLRGRSLDLEQQLGRAGCVVVQRLDQGGNGHRQVGEVEVEGGAGHTRPASDVGDGDRGESLPSDQEPVECEEERGSEEHTSELQSLMRISYAVFCLKTTKRSQEQQTR